MTLSKTLQARLVVEDPQTEKEAWDLIALIFHDNKRTRSIALKADNDDVVTIALEWFPHKYENVSGIIVHWEPFIELKMVRSMLTSEEMRLKSRDQATSINSTSSSPMVLLTNSGRLTIMSRTAPSVSNVNIPNVSYPQLVSHYTGTPGFSTPIYGPSPIGPCELHCQPAQQASSGPNSNVVGQPGSTQARHESLLPNAFNAMTLQDDATGNWNMDTSASSHLNDSIFSLTGIFNLCIYPSVLVGDGYSIPVINYGHSVLPTPHRPLHLNNVLFTPNIIKNLIYVRQFVCDNYYTVEFDAFGFSVKDFMTCRVLLRCDNTGDLYLVTKPSTIPYASHQLVYVAPMP
ncbi:hypothetical protein Tco_1435334 [Tanacetum coccineum]